MGLYVKSIYLMAFVFLFAPLSFLGCATRSITEARTPDGFLTFTDLVFPEIMWYGANLGYFPPNARDWIMNVQFSRERMEMPHMLDPSLRVWWSDDNNSILMEASYTIAPGFIGAGTRATWGQGARFFGSPTIFDVFGVYAHYQTLRFRYELRLYVERLLQTDPMFAEIIEFAKQLSAEIEYDWANFSAYRGAPVIPTPGLRRHLCYGYANEVMEKALSLPSVQAVQKWVSHDHAWNVLILVDGRRLFFDLTWFDNEHIDHETGRIIQTEDFGWANITFHEHLFRFSNLGYGTMEFTHNYGRFHSEVRR